jgi:predicted NBD/HSP70 family sugar kinase
LATIDCEYLVRGEALVSEQESARPGRAANDRVFCELLATRGPLTRTALAQLSGLSMASTVEIIERLVADEVVVRSGTDDRVRRGPKAAIFALPDDLGIALGVEVLGHSIVVRRRGLTGADLGRTEHKLRSRGSLARQITDAIGLSAADLRFRHRSIVIGLPGAVDPRTGDVLFASELPRWRTGTADKLRQSLQAATTFENEVNLRALAEQDHGRAVGQDDFLLLALGQGVGASLVLDGRLRHGAHGASGEIGYLPVPGTVLTGGRIVDGYQSAAGGWDLPHLLGEEHTPDFAWAHRLAERPASDPAWARVARAIGPGLIGMITVADPRVVILAGTVARITGRPLGAAVQAYLDKYVPWTAPQVLVSALGDDAVLEGALIQSTRRLQDLAFSTTGTDLTPAQSRQRGS